MTIKEYVNQLPGMTGKNTLEIGCPEDYGFDHQKCTYHCSDCLYVEDTINGEPAPYLLLALSSRVRLCILYTLIRCLL